MKKINNKGIVPLVWIIISLIISGLGFVGYNYFKAAQNPSYNGEQVFEPDSPIEICVGDLCEGGTFSKETIVDQCQSNKNKWGGLDPFMLVRDSAQRVRCMSCTELAINDIGSTEIINGFYKSEASCMCGETSCEPDSDIVEDVQAAEEERIENEELLDRCPAVWDINGKPIIRDYICELKFKIGQYFQPFIIILSIVISIIVFLLNLKLLRDNFDFSKGVEYGISSAIAMGIGFLLYFYFIWAVLAIVIQLLLNIFVPMVKR